MNTEIKTGGSSVPLQPGDLVTSANAPEGAPTWVGEIVRQDGGWGNCWWVQKLGHPVDTARGSALRLLTDVEAVVLGEMLVGNVWMQERGGWALHVGEVVLRAFDSGDWWACTVSEHIDCDVNARAGGTLEKAKAAASRALITYTIRGRP